MWRQNASEMETNKKKKKKKRDQDSDQSLSDDDESDKVTYDLDCASSLQSLLYSHRGKLPTPIQVDSFKGRLQGASDVNQQRKSSTSIELELFSSEFENGIQGTRHTDHQSLQSQPTEQYHTDSSCESISDEENMVLIKLSVASSAYKFQGSPHLNSSSKNHKGDCTWSTILEEAKELSCFHERACNTSFISHISEPRKSIKSGRKRAKPKFSIHTHLHSGEVPSFHVMDRNEESSIDASESFAEQNNLDHKTLKYSKDKLLGYLEEDNQELHAKLDSHEPMCALPSMAELLDNLAEKNAQSPGPLDLNAGARELKAHCSGRKTTPHLGSRILDNDDPLEFMGSGTSSGDEDYHQNHLSLAREKVKQQTMGDLFQETFNISGNGSPLLPKNKNAGSGYYGRLQQVMQIERDRHMEFLRQLQTGQSPQNDLSCITGQIVSRYLEARLTVCHCLLVKSTKNHDQCDNDSQKCVHDEGTQRRTVIFSSRFCGSVELEVGSLVRIQPPWKEVLIDKDEKIILCSYFSQIME